MATVTIDGNDYEYDSLSEKAKENLVSLQFVQNEIKRVEAQIAVFKTAESAYSRVLKSEIDNSN
tara:strand:- start:96 stop:287 length:192 start_codon:yes stop_codon:yes gene_type:complete